MTRSLPVAVVGCALAVAVAGCHQQIDYIQVTPDVVTFKNRNEDKWLSAMPKSHKGTEYPQDVSWSVKDPSVATIDAAGKVRPVKSGRTEVVASLGDVKAMVPVEVVLIDASNLGEKIKDGKNQKTVLTLAEEQRIIDVFNAKRQEEDFSVVVDYEQVTAKNYSLSAGQYFDVKIDYVDITSEQFAEKMKMFNDNLESLFSQSRELEAEIKKQLAGLKYE